MLADAGNRGRADRAFIARFAPELLDLVTKQLATADREIRIVHGRPIEAARVRITNAGRQTLNERISITPLELVDGDHRAETVMS